MKLTHILLVLLALVVSLTVSACVDKRTDDGKYRIALTIAPTKALLERMVDTASMAQIETKVLLPSGTIPESYEPTVETVAFLEQCDAWYYIGDLGFETKWLDIIKQINPDIKLVRLDEGLKHILVEHKHGDKVHRIADPHYWFSIQGMEVMVNNLEKALQEVFPSGVNTISLRKEIQHHRDNLQTYISSSDKGKIPNLIVYHPALTYLARELGCKQFVIEQDGKEPSPAHLADLMRAWQVEHTAHNTHLGEAHTIQALGTNPRLVVLKEYKDMSLALAKTYGLQLLMQDAHSPYVLDLFAEDVWAQMDYFYLPKRAIATP